MRIIANFWEQEDKERLLIDQDTFDAIEETDLIDSDSEGELYLENSLFFGKKNHNQETIIWANTGVCDPTCLPNR